MFGAGKAGGEQAASRCDESPGSSAAHASSTAAGDWVSIGRTKLDRSVAGAPAAARAAGSGDAHDAITDADRLPYSCADRGGRQPGKSAASRVGRTRHCGARAADGPTEPGESETSNRMHRARLSQARRDKHRSGPTPRRSRLHQFERQANSSQNLRRLRRNGSRLRIRPRRSQRARPRLRKDIDANWPLAV